MTADAATEPVADDPRASGWHTDSAERVFERVDSSAAGLSGEEAAARLAAWGSVGEAFVAFLALSLLSSRVLDRAFAPRE